MCPACLVTILAAGVGTVGGASALLWAKGRKAKPPTPNPEPPSASFKEWVAAVVSLEEALRATGPQFPVGREAPSRFDERV